LYSRKTKIKNKIANKKSPRAGRINELQKLKNYAPYFWMTTVMPTSYSTKKILPSGFSFIFTYKLFSYKTL